MLVSNFMIIANKISAFLLPSPVLLVHSNKAIVNLGYSIEEELSFYV